MSYQIIPLSGNIDLPETARRQDVNNKNFLLGRLNVTGSFTLTAASATTTLTFNAGVLSSTSTLCWEPTTVNAAVAIAGLYESARNISANTITLTHAITASVDRTFKYILLG